MKLKEEINIEGATLNELVVKVPSLSELKQIALKTYEVPEPMTEGDMEAISEGYRARLSDDDWRMIMKGMNRDRLVMIFSLEKEGIREKLQVILISSSEISELVLTGKIDILALQELRDAILSSVPEFENLQRIANIFGTGTSPSQDAGSSVERWNEIISKYPDRVPPELYYHLALAYEQEEDFKMALSKYDMVTQMANVPEWILVKAYYGAGWASERMGNISNAKRYYQDLLDRFSKWEGQEKDYLAAAEAALRRIDMGITEPQSTKALMEKADYWFHNARNYDTAIDAYSRIVNTMPNSSYAETALLKIGLAYGHLKQPEKQIEALERAAKDYPGAISHIYLGMAYQDMEKYDEAIKQYDTAINSYKDSTDLLMANAYYKAAGILQGLGRNEEAKSYYKRLLDKYGNQNTAIIADAEKEFLKLEKGGSLPFLGLGFRYTGAVEGAYIVTVFKNGPSSAAGVQRGDVLLAIDSKSIPDPSAVVRLIASKNVGDKVMLTIRRGEEKMEIPVILIETPEKLER